MKNTYDPKLWALLICKQCSVKVKGVNNSREQKQKKERKKAMGKKAFLSYKQGWMPEMRQNFSSSHDKSKK